MKNVQQGFTHWVTRKMLKKGLRRTMQMSRSLLGGKGTKIERCCKQWVALKPLVLAGPLPTNQESYVNLAVSTTWRSPDIGCQGQNMLPIIDNATLLLAWSSMRLYDSVCGDSSSQAVNASEAIYVDASGGTGGEANLLKVCTVLKFASDFLHKCLLQVLCIIPCFILTELQEHTFSFDPQKHLCIKLVIIHIIWSKIVFVVCLHIFT